MSKINEHHNTISIAFCNSENMKDSLCYKFDIITKDIDILTPRKTNKWRKINARIFL